MGEPTTFSTWIEFCQYHFWALWFMVVLAAQMRSSSFTINKKDDE